MTSQVDVFVVDSEQVNTIGVIISSWTNPKPAFNSSKLAIKTLEEGVKYVQI